MKKLGCGVLFVCLGMLILITYLMDNLPDNKNEQMSLTGQSEVEKSIFYEERPVLNRKPSTPSLKEDGLHNLIGEPVTALEEVFGEPSRIDKSAYDYDWWVYPNSESYIQIGVENDQVVTVYFIGEENELTFPFYIGQLYEDINNEFTFTEQISFNLQANSFQFNLTEEELLTRPLLKIDDVFIQLYFDTFTKSLSGIRYLDGKTLVKHRPYSVVYRGELIEAKKLTAEEWSEVEKGAALQILDITNEIRKRHQLNELQWDEETSIVAFHHSEDMKLNEYFSHTSPAYGELKDRLKKQGIFYQLAGENIAAKYVDAIAVVEGWLNSEGHRVNLLHEDFTHLGVGVYELYYTQNFITPW
ncbi:MAG: CAP domain-containing protein [Anaerobacillus sp.]|uniref:CAP domain-containing protein n=1 Tax=Anaerobacillus sp. TaxID=1872506 RepID=UPI00391AB237